MGSVATKVYCRCRIVIVLIRTSYPFFILSHSVRQCFSSSMLLRSTIRGYVDRRSAWKSDNSFIAAKSTIFSRFEYDRHYFLQIARDQCKMYCLTLNCVAYFILFEKNIFFKVVYSIGMSL